MCVQEVRKLPAGCRAAWLRARVPRLLPCMRFQGVPCRAGGCAPLHLRLHAPAPRRASARMHAGSLCSFRVTTPRARPACKYLHVCACTHLEPVVPLGRLVGKHAQVALQVGRQLAPARQLQALRQAGGGLACSALSLSVPPLERARESARQAHARWVWVWRLVGHLCGGIWCTTHMNSPRHTVMMTPACAMARIHRRARPAIDSRRVKELPPTSAQAVQA